MPRPVALTKRERYLKMRAELEQGVQSFLTHWRELCDYIMPRRGRFSLSDRGKGERRSNKIIDSTATFAARTMSAGMMSGITSPARPWYRLDTPDPDLSEQASVKDWLHIVTQRTQTILSRSNWYNVLPLFYFDLGIFGTAALMIEEDDRDVIRCTSFPVGQYYLANDARGEVAVFMREFGMTLRQLVEKFTDGEDLSNLSATSRQKWEDGQADLWIDIVHVIEPNRNYDATQLQAKYKRFVDCYFEKASGEPEVMLREGGYDEFPVMASRWTVTGEDQYGTDCPGMTTLGDIKQLQLGEKRGMQAIEKAYNPPMVAPPEMRSFKLSVIPGEVSYVPEGPNKSFRPAYEVKPDIQPLEYKQEQKRQLIRRGFYEDLFLMLAYSDPTRGKQPVTAKEIATREEEKLLALGPVLQQVEQGLLKPALDRIFAIAVRAGMIPVPPQELEGVSIKVTFISIMHSALQMVGISGLERHVGFVTNLALSQFQSGSASAWDKLDVDQSIDEHAQMMGVPPRIVVPDEEVVAKRAARADAERAAQQAQLAESQAATAKTLSETDTEKPSALKLVAAQAAATGVAA